MYYEKSEKLQVEWTPQECKQFHDRNRCNALGFRKRSKCHSQKVDGQMRAAHEAEALTQSYKGDNWYLTGRSGSCAIDQNDRVQISQSHIGEPLLCQD
jgi:hypothetical protein